MIITHTYAHLFSKDVFRISCISGFGTRLGVAMPWEQDVLGPPFMEMTLYFSLWTWLRTRHLPHNRAAVPTLNSIWRLPVIFLPGVPGSEVEKSRPASVLNSLVSVTILQPLRLVCVDLRRSTECRCKVSGDLERCVGKESLSIYPPRFSSWVYEIN